MREAISVHSEAISMHVRALGSTARGTRLMKEAISMHSEAISMHSEHLGAEHRERDASDVDAVEHHRTLVDGIEPRE